MIPPTYKPKKKLMQLAISLGYQNPTEFAPAQARAST
jgi:hypothetical protein